MKKVLFLGLGYIGLPTAAVAATHGYQVIGVDVNPVVVDTINQGKIHIVEPDLDKIVKEAVQKGNLRAVSKPETADAFFVVVPTPFKQNHRADIMYVESATRSVIPYLKAGDLFVIESTSPVFTTERMSEIIYKERPTDSIRERRMLAGSRYDLVERNNNIVLAPAAGWRPAAARDSPPRQSPHGSGPGKSPPGGRRPRETGFCKLSGTCSIFNPLSLLLHLGSLISV